MFQGLFGTATSTAGTLLKLWMSDFRIVKPFACYAGQEVDRDNHSWGNYVMCAYKGVHEHLASAGRPAPPLVGLRMLVDGRVPQGALT